MKFGICNEIFDGWSLESTLTYAKQAGYDAVEIAPMTITPYVTDISMKERDRIRETAARVGIEISGIHWVLRETEGIHLTHPDQVVRDRTANYFCDLVDFCNDIGGQFIINGSPKQRNLEAGVTREQAIEWARSTLKSAVKIAEDRGITICFEPLAPTETNFITTAQEGIEFIKPFASRAMKIILDVKAMCSEGRPIPEIIRESWPHFAYFHANDENLKGPGFGKVDFAPIASALREVGYNGFVSVEVFKFEEGPEAIATQSIEYLKKAFGTA